MLVISLKEQMDGYCWKKKKKRKSRVSGEYGGMYHNRGLELSSYTLATCSDGTGKDPPPASEHLSRSLPGYSTDAH